jgi:hypothetical protein
MDIGLVLGDAPAIEHDVAGELRIGACIGTFAKLSRIGRRSFS